MWVLLNVCWCWGLLLWPVTRRRWTVSPVNVTLLGKLSVDNLWAVFKLQEINSMFTFLLTSRAWRDLCWHHWKWKVSDLCGYELSETVKYISSVCLLIRLFTPRTCFANLLFIKFSIQYWVLISFQFQVSCWWSIKLLVCHAASLCTLSWKQETP